MVDDTGGHPQAPEGPAPGEELLGMITGYWASQAVFAATKLGIADLLGRARGPVRIWHGSRCRPRAAVPAPARIGERRRVPRTTPPGVVRPDPHGRTAPLRRGRVAARLALQEYQYPPWGELLHSLRSEDKAFEHLHGEPLFDFLAGRPDVSSVFDDAMADRTAEVAQAVVDAYDFARFEVLVDIGGGSGLLLCSILRANPGLRGVLFDLPHVAPRRRTPGRGGSTDRCATRGGDFFEAVSTEGDLYLLKWIVHDWDDERAVRLLRRSGTSWSRATPCSWSRSWSLRATPGRW